MSGASLFSGLATGAMLGLLFYGGLWITVRTLMMTQHPVAMTLGSFLFRVAVTVTGFLLIARGGWQNALACFAGFVAGRIAVSRFVVICT